MPDLIAQNLQKIRERINESCARAGRNPTEIAILAATKDRSVEQINDTIEAGICLFGENYLQEAEKKIEEIGREGIEWHFIGHLQSNKAKKAVELFSCIQSLDREKLARKINDAAASPFPVFIEVNIGSEESKFGVKPNELPLFFDSLKEFEKLRVRGLMCMAPLLPSGQVRPFFRKMKELEEQLSLKELSMGMSNDYQIAVEESSTMIRLGTALFGERK